MASTNSLSSFQVNSAPLSFEVQKNGRVLIIWDAFYHAGRWHCIKLERNGLSIFGLNLIGRKFTGITEDVVRQVQATYGIALKTLQVAPNEAAFWGDRSKTSYFTSKHATEDLASGKPFRGLFTRLIFRDTPTVKTSYPYGNKKDDAFLSQEDAARFGASQMTLHDAIQLGIWEALDIGSGSLSSAAHLKTKDAGTNLKATKNGEKSSGLDQSSKSSTDAHSPNAPQEQDNQNADKAKTNELLKQSKADQRQKNGPISKFVSIPTYRAKFTPKEDGYDQAPFAERRRRIIEHLDKFSPIPFSAFVDDNKGHRIDPFLFSRMLKGIEKLTVNPDVNDPDAKYMKTLLEHWCRAAYHYLNVNSEPGDGYPQILAQLAGDVKDEQARIVKAKELYWRHHATIFWMTLIDLFARKKLGIEELHKILSSKTSLNPWF